MRPPSGGCAFLDLAAHSGPDDAPLIALVRHHKAALRDRFTRLALESGTHDAICSDGQLLALWDGALSDAFIEGDVAPIAAGARGGGAAAGSHRVMQRDPTPWLVALGLSLGPAVGNGLARFAYGLILPAMQSDRAWNLHRGGLAQHGERRWLPVWVRC